ncbi:MAG TPA: RNA-binding protein, partial [Candidatus Moranbacteria bacterium]|nr:RNA-binding protein [Candidatus Moranbacteria bacterium]
MKIHKMKLATTPFEKIASGNKVIESRLYDEKRQQINLGDQIEFVCNDDQSRKV